MDRTLEDVDLQNGIPKDPLALRAIKFIVLVFVLVVWTVVGMIAYIPLLVRMIGKYSLFVLLTTFQANEDMWSIQQDLNFAILFYPSGFQVIVRAFHENQSVRRTNHVLSTGNAIKDLVWTFGFWGTTLLLYFRIYHYGQAALRLIWEAFQNIGHLT